MNELNVFVTMVNKRGRVINVRQSDVEEMKKEGAIIVNNPKQEYYPEYDQEYIGRPVFKLSSIDFGSETEINIEYI